MLKKHLCLGIFKQQKKNKLYRILIGFFQDFDRANIFLSICIEQNPNEPHRTLNMMTVNQATSSLKTIIGNLLNLSKAWIRFEAVNKSKDFVIKQPKK